MDEVIDVTERVLRTLRPHLPAIAVFAVVFFALSRLGLTRSIVWSLVAPIVFAMITEYLADRGRAHGAECEPA